jgi:hypothetical protein
MEKNITTTRSGVAAPGQLQLDLDTDFHFQHVADALPEISLRLTRRPRTKLATILREFCMGRNMNRFEAEAHNDHCLHSTVSTLKNGYGIEIEREFETVPCLRGRRRVRCKRYWLDTTPANTAAARMLLAHLERRS